MVGILYIACILFACAIMSARNAMTQQAVSDLVGRVATLEDHLVTASNAIRDAGMRGPPS